MNTSIASTEIPEGYIQPSGTLTLTSENLCDYYYNRIVDVTAYKYLVINISVYEEDL